MTPDQLAACERFAAGPLDGYVLHDAQPAVRALLAERERLQRLNESLAERVAAQSECLSRRAEQVGRCSLSHDGRGELLSRTVRPFAEALTDGR